MKQKFHALHYLSVNKHQRGDINMKRFGMIFIVILFALFNASTVFSQNISATQLQKQKQSSEEDNMIAQLKVNLDSKIANTKYDCLLAFGNEKFCDCLSEELPLPIGFKEYIAIITTNKSELLSKYQDKDSQLMINGTYETRDYCVKKSQQATAHASSPMPIGSSSLQK